ncbi:hypothetical protein [Poseidonibacter antarcticus]|uniref:hypothetical protein n=1 Tax=Poseidonibacter antarcticus TaxID=2478538 RepID=UPI0013CE71EC|nr:hypothetical protein [Poseidonibacter antarcticus]
MKKILYIVLIVIIAKYGYDSYIEKKEEKRIANKIKKVDDEIKTSLRGISSKIKNYKILYAGKIRSDINDYYIQGKLKDGKLFRAYIQYNGNNNGVQYSSYGLRNCWGSFLNPKYSLCDN